MRSAGATRYTQANLAYLIVSGADRLPDPFISSTRTNSEVAAVEAIYRRNPAVGADVSSAAGIVWVST